MSRRLERDSGNLAEEIFDLAGERFNIQSPSQLGVILFEKLGLPVLGRTRKMKKYSTGADVLEQLAQRGFDLPAKVLQYGLRPRLVRSEGVASYARHSFSPSARYSAVHQRSRRTPAKDAPRPG